MYFASGLSGEGEIRGFSDVGVNVGVTARTIGSKDEALLRALAGTETLVFCDSGAFGEVEFIDGTRRVKDPIAHEDWVAVLNLYRRLGEALKGQLFVVAPDSVGDQEETFLRLERYADEVRRIANLGVSIIVPHQRGTWGLAAFNDRVSEILGDLDFIVGLPSNKAAHEVSALLSFLIAAKPRRVHFLGVGPASRGWGGICDLVTFASPDTEIFCDSVPLRAVVGQGRPFTVSRREAEDDALAAAWSEGVEGVGDYTDTSTIEIDDWLPKSHRSDFVLEIAELSGVSLGRGDLTAICNGSISEWIETVEMNDWGFAVIDRYWSIYAHRAAVPWVERTAICRVFGDTRRGRVLRCEMVTGQLGLFGNRGE